MSLSQSDAGADIPSGMKGALCEALLTDGEHGLSALAGLPAREPASGHCFNQQSNKAEEDFCQARRYMCHCHISMWLPPLCNGSFSHFVVKVISSLILPCAVVSQGNGFIFPARSWAV